jgi:hypothetical protein
VFWHQPLAPDDARAGGIRQEQIMWTSSACDAVDADDVHEVIAWADGEARRRGSIYTLDAVVTTEGGEGIVWIAGHDPSVTGRNFERRCPPDLDPVH